MLEQFKDRCQDCLEVKYSSIRSTSRRRSIFVFSLLLMIAVGIAGATYLLKLPDRIVSIFLYIFSLVFAGMAIEYLIKEGLGRSMCHFVQDNREHHLHQRKPRIIDRNGGVVEQGLVFGRLFEGFVLQLRHGGWFRRCQLLIAHKHDTGFSKVTSWKISCWRGDSDIHLEDQCGQRRGPYTAGQAYAIVTRYVTFSQMDEISTRRVQALRIAISFLDKMQQFLAEGRKGTGWGDSKYAQLMREALGMVQESMRNQILSSEGGDLSGIRTAGSDKKAEVIIETLTAPAIKS